MPKPFQPVRPSRGRILLAGAAALLLADALAVGALLLCRAREIRRRENTRLALLRAAAVIAERERTERERLLAQFRRELKTRCRPHFEAARRGAAAAAQKLGNWSACAAFGAAAVRDRAGGSGNFETAYLALLDEPVIRPCLAAERAARAALDEYALRLRENRLAFTVALAAAYRETADPPPPETSSQLRRMLEAAAKRTVALHAARAAAVFGAALEAAFWRSGSRSVARLFAAAAAKFCGSAAAGGACAAADGPLPVGDLVGGLLTIGGGLWTAYDLYEVSCVLPRQLAEELHAGVGECETRLFADCEARAAELDAEFRRDAESIAAGVRRILAAEEGGTPSPRRRKGQ